MRAVRSKFEEETQDQIQGQNSEQKGERWVRKAEQNGDLVGQMDEDESMRVVGCFRGDGQGRCQSVVRKRYQNKI